MRSHSYSLSLAASLRPLLRRALLIGLLLASVALIYAEKNSKNWVDELRHVGIRITAPVANAVASPVRAIEEISTGWSQMWRVYGENRQLRLENEQLLQWREAALQLEAENAALRQLMHYQPQQGAHFISGKVIGAAGSSLSQRMTIDVGLDEGVHRFMPVVNGHGLIGRTLSVSGHYSQVLMVTDVNSRIPVVLQPSGIHALLIGDQANLPYLKLANPKQVPPLGEVVMTSDDGALLPEGLRVGALFAQRDGRYEVLPDFQDKPLGYVRVIDRQK